MCLHRLQRVIKSKQKLSEDHIIYFSYQIARGLEYMHSGGIIHGNLRPNNLVVNCSNCRIRINDFAHSQTVNQSDESLSDENMDNLWYCAPELIMNCNGCVYSVNVSFLRAWFRTLVLGHPTNDPLYFVLEKCEHRNRCLEFRLHYR